jgi:hypothetical protein
VPLPDTVRTRKNSFTPIESESLRPPLIRVHLTKVQKRPTEIYHKDNKLTLYTRSLRILVRCGMQFHHTQMGPPNGFPSRLWQLVRTFTVKFVMSKSELLFTKFVRKDTTRRTTPGSPSHIHRDILPWLSESLRTKLYICTLLDPTFQNYNMWSKLKYVNFF